MLDHPTHHDIKWLSEVIDIMLIVADIPSVICYCEMMAAQKRLSYMKIPDPTVLDVSYWYNNKAGELRSRLSEPLIH